MDEASGLPRQLKLEPGITREMSLSGTTQVRRTARTTDRESRRFLWATTKTRQLLIGPNSFIIKARSYTAKHHCSVKISVKDILFKSTQHNPLPELLIINVTLNADGDLYNTNKPAGTRRTIADRRKFSSVPLSSTFLCLLCGCQETDNTTRWLAVYKGWVLRPKMSILVPRETIIKA